MTLFPRRLPGSVSLAVVATCLLAAIAGCGVALPDAGSAGASAQAKAEPLPAARSMRPLDVSDTPTCLTDTDQADFLLGSPDRCDLDASPGDVLLALGTSIDQQNVTFGTNGVGITASTYGGQTFTPSVSGSLVQVDLNLFCSGCTGTTPDLTLSLRATSGGLPTGSDLASATISGFSSGVEGFHTATFASPPVLTVGTQYAFVIHPTANPSPGTYALTRSGTSTAGADTYAGGTRISGTSSGTVWSIPLTGGVSTDSGFKIYLKAHASAGSFVSSVKDGLVTEGALPLWQTLSWTSTIPASTSAVFQVAASDSASGPFTFVGPDGTAGTYFSNGASLSQFNGHRYLQYQAFLGSSDPEQTPILSDVTTCFLNSLETPTLAVSPAGGSYGGSVDLAASLNLPDGGALVGRDVRFTLNGADAGVATTDESGTALVSGISLVGLAPSIYDGGVAASYAGEPGYVAVSGAADLTVAKAAQVITFPAISSFSWSGGSAALTASASSDLAIVYSVQSGPCSVSGATLTATAAGSCVVAADQPGDANHLAAAQGTASATVLKAAQTIDFPAISGFAWDGGAATLGATATSGLPVTYSLTSGPCALSGSNLTATRAGTCEVKAEQAGSSNFEAAPPVTASVEISGINAPPHEDGGGCSATGSDSLSGLALVLAALIWQLRRRRLGDG